MNPDTTGGLLVERDHESAPASSALGDLRVAGWFAAAMIVLDVALGFVWALWSPDRFAAVLYPHGAILPDTDSYNGTRMESWIAGDGRFLLIAAVVGVLAGVVAWWLRAGNRGPLIAVALVVGGVLGSLAMDLTGYLSGGGDGDGAYKVTLVDGSVLPYTKQLPLQVHTTGVLLVQAGIAVLIYALCVAFASRDDLGRPDPVRDRLAPQPQVLPPPVYQQVGSVDAGDHPQRGWGDGDAPGPLQQGDLPPQ